jgi:[CysO sulfur-carrier protein]-S-L-cysteine hydrolase
VRIRRDLLDAIVDHARRDAPNECCGMVASTRDRVAVSVHPTTNAEASPYRFDIDRQELYDTYMGIEDAGYEIGAIYHSHTRSEPYPSPTDVNFAKQWPGVEWLIVGLQDGEPVVRSYLIDKGVITEVPVAVD